MACIVRNEFSRRKRKTVHLCTRSEENNAFNLQQKLLLLHIGAGNTHNCSNNGLAVLRGNTISPYGCIHVAIVKSQDWNHKAYHDAPSAVYCMKLVTSTFYSTWCIMICLVIPILSLLLCIQSLRSLYGWVHDRQCATLTNNMRCKH